MAIWKMRRGHKGSKPQNFRPYGKTVSTALLLCSLSFASAEITTHIKITPLFSMPIASTIFSRGLGANLAVEVQPVKLLCLTVEGEYLSLTKKADALDPVQLLSLQAGAGIRLPLSDRFVFGADLTAGIYTASDANNDPVNGITAGGKLSFFYRLSPAFSTGVQGSPSHYALMPQALMTSIGAGPSLAINLNQAFNSETNMRSEIKSIDPVFPVLYAWYNDNSFAEMEIFNDEDNSVENVQVYFYLEQYMNQPKLCGTAEKLEKGASFTTNLTAFFNERVLELTEKTDTKAKIIVEYTSLSKKMKKEIPVTIPVYHRNAMSWKDDRRAAAFVSSKDPAALWFAKYISSVVKDSFRTGINTNLQYAMGLFEAVNTFGLNYVIDPSSAYADNIDGESIDFLQFPYQTLMYRGGDCDDISILFCSLLEAVGIETAFITIPGHIYMAFSAGITEQQARESFSDPSLLIMHEGNAWIPLEITLTKEGFDKAWRIGAREWNTAAASNAAKLYPMQKSWELYRPISVPGAQAAITMPQQASITTAFTNSMDIWVEKEIRPQVTELTQKLARNDTAETRNRLGVLYATHGMLNEAETHFIEASNKRYLPAYINLANIYFSRQEYQKAAEWYAQVLLREPVNTVALLGSARSLYELDDYAHSDIFYGAVKKYDQALASQYAYLGSFSETAGRSWSLADRLAKTQWITVGNYIEGTQKQLLPVNYDTLANSMGIAGGGLTAELSIVQKTDGRVTLASSQKNLVIARTQNTAKREEEEEEDIEVEETVELSVEEIVEVSVDETEEIITEQTEEIIAEIAEIPVEPSVEIAEVPVLELHKESEMIAVLEPAIVEKKEENIEVEEIKIEPRKETVEVSVDETEEIITEQTEEIIAEIAEIPVEPSAEIAEIPVEPSAEIAEIPVLELHKESEMIAVLEPAIVEKKEENIEVEETVELSVEEIVEAPVEKTEEIIAEQTDIVPVEPSAVIAEVPVLELHKESEMIAVAEPVIIERKEENIEIEKTVELSVEEIVEVSVEGTEEIITEQTDAILAEQEEKPKKNLSIIVLGIIAGLGTAAVSASVLIGKIFKHKAPKA